MILSIRWLINKIKWHKIFMSSSWAITKLDVHFDKPRIIKFSQSFGRLSWKKITKKTLWVPRKIFWGISNISPTILLLSSLGNCPTKNSRFTSPDHQIRLLFSQKYPTLIKSYPKCPIKFPSRRGGLWDSGSSKKVASLRGVRNQSSSRKGRSECFRLTRTWLKKRKYSERQSRNW